MAQSLCSSAEDAPFDCSGAPESAFQAAFFSSEVEEEQSMRHLLRIAAEDASQDGRAGRPVRHNSCQGEPSERPRQRRGRSTRAGRILRFKSPPWAVCMCLLKQRAFSEASGLGRELLARTCAPVTRVAVFERGRIRPAFQTAVKQLVEKDEYVLRSGRPLRYYLSYSGVVVAVALARTLVETAVVMTEDDRCSIASWLGGGAQQRSVNDAMLAELVADSLVCGGQAFLKEAMLQQCEIERPEVDDVTGTGQERSAASQVCWHGKVVGSAGGADEDRDVDDSDSDLVECLITPEEEHELATVAMTPKGISRRAYAHHCMRSGRRRRVQQVMFGTGDTHRAHVHPVQMVWKPPRRMGFYTLQRLAESCRVTDGPDSDKGIGDVMAPNDTAHAAVHGTASRSPASSRAARYLTGSGKWRVCIIVDKRETEWASTMSYFQENGVPCVARNLAVGDYGWLLQPWDAEHECVQAAGSASQSELMSGFLCERKTASDLVASIKDKRLFEQFGRMSVIRVAHPMLLIEGDIARVVRRRSQAKAPNTATENTYGPVARRGYTAYRPRPGHGYHHGSRNSTGGVTAGTDPTAAMTGESKSTVRRAYGPGLTYESVAKIVMSLRFNRGVDVHYTRTSKESLDVLVQWSKTICDLLADVDIGRHNIVEFTTADATVADLIRRRDYSYGPFISFDGFSELSGRSSGLTDGMIYSRMLLQIPLLTPSTVMRVMRAFPTMRALCTFCQTFLQERCMLPVATVDGMHANEETDSRHILSGEGGRGREDALAGDNHYWSAGVEVKKDDEVVMVFAAALNDRVRKAELSALELDAEEGGKDESAASAFCESLGDDPKSTKRSKTKKSKEKKEGRASDAPPALARGGTMSSTTKVMLPKSLCFSLLSTLCANKYDFP